MSKGASYAVVAAGAAAIFGGLVAAGSPWSAASLACVWIALSLVYLRKREEQR